MLRTLTALTLLSTPAAALPAHRQPTPTTVQASADGAGAPASLDAKANQDALNSARMKADAQVSVWEARVKKSLSGVCRGC